MQQFTGDYPVPAASRSAVQMNMRSGNKRAEIWTAAKVEETLKDGRDAFENARKDSPELRTIGPNADAVKNVTSGGGTRTPEARISRALATLDSLEARAKEGVTREPSGKYKISPEAISATKQFQALAGSTARLVESTLRDKAAVLARRDTELQAISAKERAKSLEEIRVTLGKLIDEDEAFSDLRSSFFTAKDVGAVSLIRQGLARIAELEARSKISGVTEADLKEAKSISQNLSILQLPRYKQETLKAQKDTRIAERQVPVKEALAEINQFRADIDAGLKERNWSASPVKNTGAQTPVGKVAHLRAQLDATTKKIEAAGADKVDGLWLDLARRQHASIRNIFDAEYKNRELRTTVQATFDKAYAIAKEKYGDVSPSTQKKGDSEKDQVEYALGKLETALRAVDKSISNGLKAVFAGSYNDEFIQGPLNEVKRITGLAEAQVSTPVVLEKPLTDAQKVDAVYEALRDIVKQGDGTWSGLRSAANTPSERLGTPQGKVAQAMSDLITLKLEADSTKPEGGKQQTLAFDAAKDYEEEARKIFDRAQQVIRTYVTSEITNTYEDIYAYLQDYWEHIKPGEAYEGDIDKTRAAEILEKAKELASTQGDLADLNLVVQARQLFDRASFVKENAHRTETLRFNYDSQYDTAKESFNFPEGYLPAYNPHAKTPQEKIESALGSIRGLAEAAQMRRNFPDDGGHIDDSWMSRADNKLADIEAAYIILSADETKA